MAREIFDITQFNTDPTIPADRRFEHNIIKGTEIAIGAITNEIADGIGKSVPNSSLSATATKIGVGATRVVGGAAATVAGTVAEIALTNEMPTTTSILKSTVLSAATVIGGLPGAVIATIAIELIESYNPTGVRGRYNGKGVPPSYGSALVPDEVANPNGMGAEIPYGHEWNALDQLEYENSRVPNADGTLGRYGYNSDGVYVDRFPNRGSDGPHNFPDPNNGLGPSAGAPGRPGPINHATGLPELAGTGYIGPQNGNSITSRGVNAPEGPEVFGGGGGNNHDPGENRNSGPSGGHAPGSQHPGNTNGTGSSGSGGGGQTGTGTNGGYSPSNNHGGHNTGPGDREPGSSSTGSNTPGDPSVHDPHGNGNGAQPIILDLDGNGIQITSLDNSTVFMDGGDGLDHRTAWAGVGDGVLFYDPDNTGEITERRQYVFTDWDPTATSDMAALASVFDSNGDGQLSGAELANFRIMVTNADGTTTSHTLARQLGVGGSASNATANERLI